ncbi:MAG: F0F1 ATP synthase subunit B [bacterium]|nr:F0F1 ATP synthase subunit B [bacterium]
MEGLGLDLPTFIGQLISFLILLGLISAFGFKPIRKMLDERSKRIQESMEMAEATKKEYEQAQAEVQKRLAQSQKQGEALIVQAREIGEKVKEEAKSGARAEAQAIIEKTQVEMKRDQDKIIDNLRREFAGIAILAAEKVIKESLDKQKHLRLIEETLEQSSLLRKH